MGLFAQLLDNALAIAFPESKKISEKDRQAAFGALEKAVDTYVASQIDPVNARLTNVEQILGIVSGQVSGITTILTKQTSGSLINSSGSTAGSGSGASIYVVPPHSKSANI